MAKIDGEARGLFRLPFSFRNIVPLIVLIVLIIFRVPVFSALLPFLLALILANIIEPVVTWLQGRLRLPRAVATVLTLAAILITVGYGALWILNNLYREVADLVPTLPTHQKTVTHLGRELTTRVQEIFEEVPSQVTEFIQRYIDDLGASATRFIQSMANGFLGTIASLPVIFITGVITVLASYFFTKDKEIVDSSILRAVPGRLRPMLADLRDKILIDLVGFFKAQFILFTINTALAALWLFLSGSSFWMLVSLILGILDVIPVLGPGLVLMPWAAVSLWQGSGGLAVSLLALFAAMFGVRQVLQAKILGDSIGIHPLLMLFAIWAGIVIFGVWGFLIGPVIVIFGKAIWNTGAIPWFRDEERPEAASSK